MLYATYNYEEYSSEMFQRMLNQGKGIGGNDEYSSEMYGLKMEVIYRNARLNNFLSQPIYLPNLEKNFLPI